MQLFCHLLRQASVSQIFVPHFDLLWSITEQTHGKSAQTIFCSLAPRREVENVDKNAHTEKKNNEQPLKDSNRKTEFVSAEEEMSEMKSSNLITKQIESLEMCDDHGELKEVYSRVKDEKNLAKLQSNGLSDTEDDILITLSETESEKSVKAGAESKDVARESHKTKISTIEEVEYK